LVKAAPATATDWVTLGKSDVKVTRLAFGTGSFSVGAIGNSLVVNFTPVPEPTTYVLMLAGLGVTVLGYRRRRR